MDEIDDETRDEYLHYIHEWYQTESPNEEVVMTVTAVEKYIMSSFNALLGSMLQFKIKPFYHDYMSTMMVTEVKQNNYTNTFSNRSRVSVRQKLGCGHFILCLIFEVYNRIEERFGDAWSSCEWWHEKKQSLDDLGLMNPETPCDGTATYQWLQTFYRESFDRAEWETDLMKEYARIPFTMLRVTGPCERNADTTSKEFMRNYQEFLVFHLHVLHDIGEMSAGPHVDQYYRLIRKQGDPPPEVISASQKQRITRTVKTVIKRKLVIERSLEVTIKQVVTRGAGQTRSLQHISSSSRRRHHSMHAESTRVSQGLTSYWRRSEHFQTSQWQQVSSGVAVKVVQQDWKVGCRGCPKAVQRTVTHTGRKRACKWVTIRRKVLVRRLVWRRPNVRRQIRS